MHTPTPLTSSDTNISFHICAVDASNSLHRPSINSNLIIKYCFNYACIFYLYFILIVLTEPLETHLRFPYYTFLNKATVSCKLGSQLQSSAVSYRSIFTLYEIFKYIIVNLLILTESDSGDLLKGLLFLKSDCYEATPFTRLIL